MLLMGVHLNAQKNVQLYIGTYTGEGSKGIYQYNFNTETGQATTGRVTEASNPSYICISADQKFLYAIHENGGDNKSGEISAYSRNAATGELTLLNTQPTGGDHPCYVSTDRHGKWVVAGNYSGGNIAVFSIREDGRLGERSFLQQHTGSGSNPDRQEKPHVHCTAFSPDQRMLLVPDLGIDRIMLYKVDIFTGALTPAAQPWYQADAGAGPRHITFSPSGKHAYLIEELSGTVVGFQWKKNRLKRIQRISTLAAGETDFAGSADIHVSPDGNFLYASNRADYNNIAIYRIDPKKGTLSLVGHQSTLGKGPRHFSFDPSGKFVLVGNQTSNQVVIFRYDSATGKLSDTGNRIEVGKPVCFAWASMP